MNTVSFFFLREGQGCDVIDMGEDGKRVFPEVTAPSLLDVLHFFSFLKEEGSEDIFYWGIGVYSRFFFYFGAIFAFAQNIGL